MKNNILIIGGGGREHVIGWKLAQSKNVGQLYFAPGNGGTEALGKNIPIASDDVHGLLQFAKKTGIDLTIVGPEASLSLGIVNKFTHEGLPIFGPTHEAAQLETSKVWASEFLKRHNLPHPVSKIFSDPESALLYSKQYQGNVVVKADGLCQGKGVFVCDNIRAASSAIRLLMINKTLGSAGDRIVIQEKLVGREISVMVFSDGTHVAPIITASDYKRLRDGNLGPNTGSMGSVAPSGNATPQQLKKIYELLQYTVQCMKKEGRVYQGVLYAGMMISSGKPYILEFNCRFGDPETEVQLPLLKSDLLSVIEACINGSLSPRFVSFSNQVCVCVILAAPGYPGHYVKKLKIEGLAKPHSKTVTVFHAGTSRKESSIITTGGRVLGITACGSTTKSARAKVYALIGKQIRFNGMQYRTDIGL